MRLSSWRQNKKIKIGIWQWQQPSIPTLLTEAHLQYSPVWNSNSAAACHHHNHRSSTTTQSHAASRGWLWPWWQKQNNPWRRVLTLKPTSAAAARTCRVTVRGPQLRSPGGHSRDSSASLGCWSLIFIIILRASAAINMAAGDTNHSLRRQ